MGFKWGVWTHRLTRGSSAVLEAVKEEHSAPLLQRERADSDSDASSSGTTILLDRDTGGENEGPMRPRSACELRLVTNHRWPACKLQAQGFFAFAEHLLNCWRRLGGGGGGGGGGGLE